MATTSEPVTELNGKKIVFPGLKSFADLFPTAKPPDGDAPRLLETEAWEAGTWSDKGRKTRSYTAGYCSVEGAADRYSMHVTATPAVLEFIRDNMLAVPWDTKTFQVHIWPDGRALVCCTFGQIIGSYYLAVIDAATVPAKMESKRERDAEAARIASEDARTDAQKRHDDQRARYMAKEITHEEFYCWLADFVGITEAMIPATPEEVKRSNDPHLNDISLSRWDGKHGHCRQIVQTKGMKSWSLSDTVCCLKSIAKRRRDRK